MHFDIRKVDSTASTNDDVKQAAENGAAEGLVVWALSQSAGRGRQGRQWQSPKGNLYFSVLLRPNVPQSEYGFYSFICALAIGDGVAGFLSPLPQQGRGASSAASIELKWPNDILVNGKKISGILLEAGDGWIVAGMGVNVLHSPEKPLYPVTCLAAETTTAPELDDVLDKVLAALKKWYEIFDTQGFVPIRAAWLDRAKKGNMRVRQGDNFVEGAFADLDVQGNLCLILKDGTKQALSTGDVFF